MHHAFQTFVDRLTESTDRHAAQKSLADITAALDLSCFAYLALPQRRGAAPRLISSYPPWTVHYLRRKYENIDPVVRRAIRQAEPFRWGLEVEPRGQAQSERELFQEAAEFGIRCGFTFPIHDSRGAIAALSFATDGHRTGFERSITKNFQNMRLIARFFHAHARRFWTSDRVVGGILLSPREFECLEWSSCGKSAGEIGIFLASLSEPLASTWITVARNLAFTRSAKLSCC